MAGICETESETHLRAAKRVAIHLRVLTVYEISRTFNKVLTLM